METIYKKICIEDFKSRRIASLPFLDKDSDAIFSLCSSGETSWGRVPMDVIVPEDLYLPMLPCYNDVIYGTEKRHNVCRYSTLIIEYYWLKNFIKETKSYRHCINGWIEDKKQFLIDIDIDLFDTFPDTEENISVFINENCDLFFSKYTSYENAIAFIEFVEKYLNGEITDEDNLSIPFCPIPIFLDSDINDMGIITPYIKDWKFGSIYYCDDIVRYNGKFYKLIMPKVGYYSGEYDNNRYKKTPDNDEHWEELVINNDESELMTTNFITDSYLPSFIRKKSSYDHEGKKLPFLYRESDGEYKIELLYALGSVNEEMYDENNYMCDILTDVIFNNGIEYNYSATTFIEEDDNLSGATQVTFVYYNDAIISSEDKTLFPNSGIRHEETYSCFYVDKEKIILDNGREAEISYLRIDITSILSNAQYSVTNTDSNEYVGDFFIKDNFDFGIQDMTGNINGNIERGTSALMERLNTLSEIKTLRDLENYRNNIFKL